MGCCFSRNKSPKAIFKGEDFPRLPPRVREKVFRYLNNKEKLRVRSVCRTFKSDVDFGAGLEVSVDDLEVGIFDFMRSVECVGARVSHLSNTVLNYLQQNSKILPNAIYRCKYSVKFLEVYGYMSIKYFEYIVLPTQVALVELVLHNVSLMNSYLNAFPPPEEPPENYHPFPCLRSLTIFYGFYACTDGSWRIFNDNMRYLLHTVYAPKLRMFRVFRDPPTLEQILFHELKIPHYNLRWESHPVKMFVQKHRASLRILELLFYRDHFTPEEQFYTCPAKLREYSLFAPALSSPLPGDLIGSYFQKLIEFQTQLRRIHLHMELWGPAFIYFKFLDKIVLPNNAQTLREISLLSYHHKLPTQDSLGVFLDFSIFSVCQRLKKLLYSASHKTKMGNPDIFHANGLSQLPCGLEELVLEGIICQSSELESIALFPNWKKVIILNAGTKLNYGINFAAARQFLIHRKIEYVKLHEFNDNGEPHIRALIEKFDGRTVDTIEIENPRSTISCWDKLGCCRCVLCLGDDLLKLT